MKKYVVYSPSEQVNTDEMLKRVKELDQSVCELALCLKWTPKIEEFITSLVAGQVDWDAGPKRYRAWVVSPTQEMPSDARVDFAFIPTAMACAASMSATCPACRWKYSAERACWLQAPPTKRALSA